jgi:DnaJ-related protein SCJ1
LIDPQTRQIYDRYGHEGLEQHKQGGGGGRRGHDPFDLFSRFFGGSGHFGHGASERRGPNQEVKLGVPLAAFYNGQVVEFAMEKQAVCSSCEGSGSADGKVDTCKVCGGHGVRIQKHQLAPGIFQQMQTVCDACGGKGKTVRTPCPVCHGTRVVRETETHEVHVERGMRVGTRIQFENEADESPDWVAGDLIVQLAEQTPELGSAESEELGARSDGTFFRRRGNDLVWREVLSLREAWMGDWTRNVTHLDGHVVRLHRKRGEVVQPNAVEIVTEEGMPIYRSDDDDGILKFGNLLVEYVVILPDQLESGMEKEFWSLWEKWRAKKAVNLMADSGRPAFTDKGSKHDEL